MGPAGGLWRGAGGFAVSLPSFNLLRYPSRRRWRAGPWLGWAGPGFGAGLLAALAWAAWCQSQQEVLRAKHQEFKALEAAQMRARQDAAVQARQAREQQQADARRKDWQLRRAQLLRLHDVLGQAALERGLRVQNWQADERRILLQAWVPQPQAWTALQTQLTAVGPQPWTLQTLASGPEAGVQFTLEAPWLAAAQAKEAKNP